ncbi:hypothetical protein J6590_032349 [Homalodisca vitripennis]|nr:hypothetical protein J6590_032349 [Homalodisca vitripennis]
MVGWKSLLKIDFERVPLGTVKATAPSRSGQSISPLTSPRRKLSEGGSQWRLGDVQVISKCKISPPSS